MAKKNIEAFQNVYDELGYGFPENVCGNAMCLEMTATGMTVQQQKNIEVVYRGVEVGDYYTDPFADNAVIVEPEATEGLRAEHEARLIN
ncbi:MAG: GxxExxY protein [Bacteroidetes bacterium]|nr:GxxExxY protein [Bacteroidota bacterium]